MSDLTFQELGLPDNLLQAITDLGYENPSTIQAMAIPPALTGEDLIGLSQTGSGKTAAFALPVLARIKVKDEFPQALIVCPTRELANQVCEEVFRLASHLKGFRAVPVYGGAPIDRQLRSLRKGAHIVVGTPGRLQDHLRRGTFDPKNIRTVVLDEADRMLDMGFRDEMEEMLSMMPEDRQTLFFSATMNKAVGGLIRKFGKNPRTIEVEKKTLTVEAIEQVSYEVRQRSRLEVLSRILDMDEPRLAIVFCNTRRVVDEVAETLNARGYAADRLHGDISQDQRERTLARFRKGVVEVLVATDVAARGIDIDEIDLVANYDLPQDPEDYVHRIGRTGRAGRKGRAVTFVYGRDIYRLQNVERYIKQRIPRGRIPSLEEVDGKQADQMFDSIREKLEAGEWKDYSEQVDRLLDQGHTATDIASVLFNMINEKSGRDGKEIDEDRPQRGRRERDDNDGPRNTRGGDDRRERPNRRNREDDGTAEEGMTRLFLSMGRNAGLQPKDIAGLLYNEANLPSGAVGRIHMFPNHCLIEVRSDVTSDAIDVAKDAKLRGKPFRLDLDKATGPVSSPDSRGPKKPYRGQGKSRR